MTKIALCFTGHVRSLKRTYENLIKTLIDPVNTHNYTTYFVTWEGEPLETIRECLPQANILTVPNIDHTNTEFIAWSNEVEMHHSWRATYPDTIKCKFRYFSQVYLLREVARRLPLENYNIVIRCRPDIFVNRSVYPFFNEMKPSTMYFPVYPKHGGFGIESEGCQSCLCWGDASAMKTTLSVLDGTIKYRHNYYESRTQKLEVNIVHDESTLYKYLNGEGININYKEYAYEFIRSNFEGCNSLEHLSFFIERMGKHTPFALIRPNDGEFMILQGEHFTNIDNWTFSGGSLRSELDLSIRYAATVPDMYIGIPCPGCWEPWKTEWYIKTYNLDEKHLTYGNIVCNKNWRTLIDYLQKERVKINYIGPGTKDVSQYLNVVSRHTISPYLLNEWDAKKTETIDAIDKYISGCINEDRCNWHTFFFSAGPISKILIPFFFTKYPKHTFIDIGSAFDPFFKGGTNRSYVIPNTEHAELVCDFKNGHGK